MNKLYLPFLVVLSLTLLVYCTKNAETQPKHKKFTEAEMIEHAKAWYEKEYGASNARTASVDVPDWRAASAQAINDVEVTTVPTYIDMVTGTVRQQIILTDVSGNTSSRIVEATPSVAYFSATSFSKRYKNFTGSVKIYNGTTTLRNTLSYTNGLKSTISREAQSTLSPPIIETIDLNEVEIIAPSLPSLSGYIVVDITPSISNSYIPMPLYPDTWGGGGGTGAPANYAVSDFTNNIKDPCLAATLSKLINGNCKSLIMQTINNVFGASGNFTIEFEDIPATQMPRPTFLGYQNNSLGTHTGGVNTPNTGGIIVIQLNADSLKGASKELQSAVIIHEALHGIFEARGLNSIDQHDLMSESYTNMIKNALQEYYPTLSDTDANALSWVGLQWNYAWSMMELRASATSASILNIINKHLKGQSGTPCVN